MGAAWVGWPRQPTRALCPDRPSTTSSGRPARRAIVDEIGYVTIDGDGANLFFQLVNARYEKGAMILTSNRGFAEWGELFGDPVVATALLDRLLHHNDGEEKTSYTRVGGAFPHKKGCGFNIEITEGISVSGQLVALPPRPRDEE